MKTFLLKNPFPLWTILVSILLLSSCNMQKHPSAKDKVATAVKAFNQKCPENVGDGIILDSCSYQNNLFSYNYKVSPDFFAHINLSSSKAEVINNFVTGDNVLILEMLVAAGSSLRFQYTDGQNVTGFNYSIEELKAKIPTDSIK